MPCCRKGAVLLCAALLTSALCVVNVVGQPSIEAVDGGVTVTVHGSGTFRLKSVDSGTTEDVEGVIATVPYVDGVVKTQSSQATNDLEVNTLG